MLITKMYITDSAGTTERPLTGGKCSVLFQLAMREAGHAYGLHDASRLRRDLVMGALYDHCTPSAKDIVALKAIYQSR